MKRSKESLFRGEILLGEDDETNTFFVEAGCLHDALDKFTEFADPKDGIVLAVELIHGDVLVEGEEDVTEDDKKPALSVVPPEAS